MAWLGSIYNQLEAFIDDIPIEESFDFIEGKLVALGDHIKKIYSDVVEDVTSPVELNSVTEQENKNSASQQNINTNEEGVTCDIINSSSYISLVDLVEEHDIDSSTTEDSDVEVYEDSDVGVDDDISTVPLANSVILAKSADDIKSQNTDSVVGVKDDISTVPLGNSVILAKSADDIKSQNTDGSSITGPSSIGCDIDTDAYCGIANKHISEEWLVYAYDYMKADVSCSFRHRNAVGENDDYSEKTMAKKTQKQEVVSRLKVVSEKMRCDGEGDGATSPEHEHEHDADLKSTTFNDEWEIV